MTEDASAAGSISEREKALILAKLDRATAAHEKTRERLDDLIADARAAKISLEKIEAHSPYSREWVRRIANRVLAARGKSDPADD